MLKDEYKKILEQSDGKKDFIAMMKKKFPELKESTIVRLFCKLGGKVIHFEPDKKTSVPEKKPITIDEISISSSLRKIKLKEMLRLNTIITSSLLLREGFTVAETEKILEMVETMPKKEIIPEKIIEQKPIAEHPQMEKVPILAIYKEGNKIKMRSTRNANRFEILGFLTAYISVLKKDLLGNIETVKDKGDDDAGEF